jgi:GDP-L-fucose synthase
MENNIHDGIYNVGSGVDVTIRELAETVKDIIGFEGNISYDIMRPNGTHRKLLDVSRMKLLGWQAKTTLKDGIAKAYVSYLKTLAVEPESYPIKTE